MPDLFDNFFGRLATTLNGGKSKPHYGGSSQVNTGRYYSYHENGTNNKYWLPRRTSETFVSNEEVGERKGSVSSALTVDSDMSSGK